MAKPTACFLTYDWSFGIKPVQPNGCAWYRCVLPMQELRQLGWESGTGMPGWNDEHGFGLLVPDGQAVHGWDVIVFKLIMMGKIADRVSISQKMGQKIVVDVDDWFEGLEKTNMAYTTTDPERNPENNREHYMRIINEADAVITSTPFLYDFYKNERKLKNVFLVRNGIDLPRWKQRRDHAGWLPTIGWVGATPWRSNDLETMQPWFTEFLADNRLEFHHSGNIKNANSAIDQLGIQPNVKTSKEPMKPILDYPQLFRKIDVGIVPLNDLKFNHAKSGIKGLEYSAAGIPFVASNSPEYQWLADQGIGRVASNKEEWISHLEQLLDPKVRKEDVERNIENIKSSQTMEIRGHEWSDVLMQIREF